MASSSHWQGAVVTQRPQRGTIKQHFSDDEDGDEDYDSGGDEGSSSSDTTCGKMGRKQNTKNNISSSKTRIKSEYKNTANASNNIGSGRRTNSKDNKMVRYFYFITYCDMIMLYSLYYLNLFNKQYTA